MEKYLYCLCGKHTYFSHQFAQNAKCKVVFPLVFLLKSQSAHPLALYFQRKNRSYIAPILFQRNNFLLLPISCLKNIYKLKIHLALFDQFVL